ncbi:hypothetical protein Lesp02_23250 [Lentzea sp. NBRC 105346]|uniref:type II secretion system F family protein n=1 Tax=Lentzea sp. NBRC 105346 TaxID=3032205 RepID=UPI0024A52E4A|nr:type II secretion system F family protein [Lentzea sp. NBRC 105346]GLZ30135.1 hypothetical protein Lesp02_23250 [Lentzea sp. NBRC 105346]
MILRALLAASLALAASEPSAELTDVRTEEGKLYATLVGHDLVTPLDPSSVRVELDRGSVPATAKTIGEPEPPGAALVVVDATGTMAGASIDRARAVVAGYLAALPADVQAGLVTFAGTAAVTVPLTLDRQRVGAALAQVRPDGTSALNDAVLLAARTIAAVPGPRRLLVLSDGEDAGSVEAADDVARHLTAAGVNADVVALDLAEGAAAAGRDQIARASGGQVLAAGDAAAIAAGSFVRPAVRQLAVTAEVPDRLAGWDVRVTVRASAGGQQLAVENATVHLAGHRGEVVPRTPSWLLFVVLGVVFTVLLGMAWMLFGRRGFALRARPQRLTEVLRYRLGEEEVAGRKPLAMRSLLTLSERFVNRPGMRERIELDLDLAGIRLRPAEWLLLRAGLAVVIGVVFGAVTGAMIICGPLGTLLGWFGTRLFLKVRVGMRRAAFGNQLPDTLQLVASALRSGFSLPQALGSVVREGTQPIAGEFARALAKTRLGMSIEDALDAAAERMKCQDLSWVVMAIRIQREVGGNLAELLLTTVHTMRERAAMRRQVKALTAEGRLSAYILIGLPVGLGLWMFISRRDYIEPLYTRPLGWVLLGIASICITVGWFWMSRLIKVEV